ncbi:MAG: hypothetical protein AABZ31_04360 [Bdellovibrionota bacterium]
MSNAMKYIRSLEAAGFERNQAEAQVQMVLDAIEGDLVTKADFSVFKEQIDNRISIVEHHIDKKIIESEFRTQSRLGVLFVSSLSVAVALLTWLIKV